MYSLKDLLNRYIKIHGQIRLDKYMNACLNHRKFGYYTTLGGIGDDFFTAAYVSPIFCNVVAVRVLELLLQDNRFKDKRCSIIEIGPGNMSLMNSIVSIGKKRYGFNHDVYLVETSMAMQEYQKRQFTHDINVTWCTKIPTTNTPTIMIANEFFDVLPIRQYRFIRGKWHEMYFNEKGFVPIPMELAPAIAARYTNEWCDEYILEEQQGIFPILEDIAKNVDWLIAMDYGYVYPYGKSTISCIKQHKFININSMPVNCDISAHVDFGLMTKMFRGSYVQTQRNFLTTSGIQLESAKKNRSVDLNMLVGSMGDTFKVFIANCR